MTEREITDELMRMAEQYKAEEDRRRVRMVAQPQAAGNAQAIPETPQSGPDLNEYAYVGAPSQPVQGEPGMPQMGLPQGTPAPTSNVFQRLAQNYQPPTVASTGGTSPFLPPTTREFFMGNDRSIMEPDLLTSQRGGYSESDIKPNMTVKDGQVVFRDTGLLVPVTQRPGVLPLTVNADTGKFEFAMPRAFDLTGSSMPSTKGAMIAKGLGMTPMELAPGEVSFGAGAVKETRTPAVKINRGEGPRTHPTLEPALEKAKTTNADLVERTPLDLPVGPEFDPWRVTPGRSEVTWDPKREKYFSHKVSSPSEKQLSKEIKRAEQELPTMERIFSPDDVFPQPLRPRDWGVRGYAKGTPDWVADQLPGMRDRAVAAIERADQHGGPWAGRFYELGRPYEDIVAARGPAAGHQFFDQWGQMMGATTSNSPPPMNYRFSTYQQARANQGLPVEAAPPYPYGHERYAPTHKPGIEMVREQGALDTTQRPKGGLFGGTLSGTADKTVVDQVETMGMGLLDKQKRAMTEPGQAYEPVMNMRDQLARELSMRPNVAQAKSWAGFQKELTNVEAYSAPMLKHMEDRILVTAKVTGRDPRDVYRDWVKKGWPVLAGAPVAFGAFQGQER